MGSSLRLCEYLVLLKPLPQWFYQFLPESVITLEVVGVTSYSGMRIVKVKVYSLSHVHLFATPWTVAPQGPLSMELARQEYWNGLPFPSPRDLPDPGMRILRFQECDLSEIIKLVARITIRNSVSAPQFTVEP